MRVLVNDVAVLEGAGLRFVGVADEVGRFGAAALDKAPLHATREARAAASTQARFFDFVDDFLGLHAEGFLELLVAPFPEVTVDVVGPAFAVNVLEDDALFPGMRRAHPGQRGVATLEFEEPGGVVGPDAFLEEIVHHGDRGAATTGQALDELDRVLAIGGNGDGVAVVGVGMVGVFLLPLVQIDPGGGGDFIPEFVAAGHGAGERAANANVAFAGGMAAEHRVEGDQLEDIDGLELELAGNPGNGVVDDDAKMLLPEMQERQ